MKVIRALQDALEHQAWDDVDEILDGHFFRCLILDPDLLDRVFAAVPAEWYDTHPRHGMSRAIADAARHPLGLIDDTAQARFHRWVQRQSRPLTRDVLGSHQAKLRAVVAHGWYDKASLLVDDVLATIRAAHATTAGFADVLPSVYIRCGVAKMLAGDTETAATCFSEALHWAQTNEAHPYTRFARAHLALSHALDERYADAARLLDADDPPAAPDTMAHRLGAAGLFARILIALADLDTREARRLLSRIDRGILTTELGWISLHARAAAAIADGDPWEAIHAINTELVTNVARHSPCSFSGALLRADLVALYQSADDLRAAERVLATAALLRREGAVVVPLARQALLRGRPEQALAVLHQNEVSELTSIPARHTPSGAVLYASAELAASSSVAETTLRLAATAVTHHAAPSALTHATPELRERLLPLVRVDPTRVPTPWRFRPRVRLTRREREVLRALESRATLTEVASALHVSVNTAKSHVRALYRKLGAHTRDEAIWLGRE